MFILLLLIFCSVSELSISTDFISSTRSLRDPESITSNGGIFRMGFFTPSGSKDRYVGIWYNGYSYLRPVWVANREKPIKDSSGTVMISEDGNLVIQDGKEAVVWSSNITNTRKGNATVRLLDTGNLVVLLDSNSSMSDPPGASGGIVWQSFEHMSDSFLQKMALISNARTNVSLMVTSWKSLSDPSRGGFSFGIKPLNIPEAFIWNGSRPYWRSGPWNGQRFIGVPSMESIYQYGFSLQNDNEGNFFLTYSLPLDFILYYVLEPNGTLLESYSGKGENEHFVSWSSHKTDCDVYGKCGPFGICDPSKSPICSCPRGFRPEDLDEWGRGNWSGGCVRKTSINCGSSSDSNKKDGFLKIPNMKVPAFPDQLFLAEDECARSCLSNCSCLAHAYEKGVGCMSWRVGLGLIDMQKLSGAGVDIHIRLPTEELGKTSQFHIIFINEKCVAALGLFYSQSLYFLGFLLQVIRLEILEYLWQLH